MDADEGFDDEGPFSPWVPPDDRLWRHPSEAAANGPGRTPDAPGPTLVTGPNPALKAASTRLWATALIAGVVGALLASGIGLATGTFDRTVVHNSATLATPTTAAGPRLSETVQPTASWSLIDDQISPSMVTISGTGDSGQVEAAGMLWQPPVWETAYILAAAGALDGVGSLTVSFAGGASTKGTIVGTDPLSGLAVISVPSSSVPAADSAQIGGPLSDVHVGDPLATVGPATQSGGAFVPAWVGGLDQMVTDSDAGLTLTGMIGLSSNGQVNIGSAVVDGSGEVVALTVEGPPNDSNSTGQSYAIPMDIAEQIATDIINGNRPWHPYIGVLQAEDLPTAMANQLGLPGGAQVESVAPGSPAAAAGLSPNDIIVSLDNAQVNSTASLLDVLSQCNRGSRVSIRYLHKGKAVNQTLTVEAQPPNPPQN